MVNDSFFINNYPTPEKLTNQVYTFAVQSVPVMSPIHVVNELSDLDRLITLYARKQNVPTDFKNKIAYYQAILMQRKGADEAAAASEKKKKKTVVGGILQSVGDFSVDVAKLGVQGLSVVPNALNGGKSVLGKEWDPTTGLGKLIDSGVDKADSLGHKVGQTWVKGVTGGAVDLSKGGIFQKGGLEKSIDLEKLAAKAASTASSAASKNKNSDSPNTSGGAGAAEGLEDVSTAAAALDAVAPAASALESTNFKSKDMNALDFLNKASTTVLGADTSSLQNQYTDIAKAQAEQLLKEQFNALTAKKKTNPTQQMPIVPTYNAPLGPLKPQAKAKPVSSKRYVYLLGWVNKKTK